MSVFSPLLWFSALALLGCDAGSVERACEPVQQTGCSRSTFCAVDGEGVPKCFAPEEVPEANDCPGDDRAGCRLEGASCETSGQCALGLGCLRVGGAARCLRFCDPVGVADGPESCDATARPTEEGGHPAGALAQCIGLLQSRPDIGACALPCSPGGDPLQCPTDLSCGLVPGSPFAMCISPGEAEPGAPCGPDRRCVAGQLCARWGGGRVCRPPAAASGECFLGSAVPLPNTRNENGDGPLAVCQICLDVGTFASRRYIACPTGLDQTGAAAICASEGASLADLTGFNPEQYTALQLTVGGVLRQTEAVAMWTIAVVAEGRWRWSAAGFEVESVLWGATVPAAVQGRCGTMPLTGTSMRSEACETAASALCVIDP